MADLLAMNAKELRNHAEELGVIITGLTRKAAIAEAIAAHQATLPPPPPIPDGTFIVTTNRLIGHNQGDELTGDQLAGLDIGFLLSANQLTPKE